MQPVEDDNQRWLLEQEREELIRQKAIFDQVYGPFATAFLFSVQAMALMAFLFIFCLPLYYRTIRTKTNFIVAIWALINYAVLLETLLGMFTKWNLIVIDDTLVHLTEMLAAVGRQYGTVLAIIWVYSKFFTKPSEKADYFIYFLMAGPALIFAGYAIYTVFYNEFIYEVYGPACDIGNVVVYSVLIFIYLLLKCFARNEERSTSKYPLLVTLTNLLTSFPICLAAIYLRFNLDIGYVYRFHIFMVDFGLKLIQCSSAFIVLFLIVHFHKCIKLNFLRQSAKV